MACRTATWWRSFGEGDQRVAGPAAIGDTAGMTVTNDLPFEAHLEHVRAAPRDTGRIELIVRRPQRGERDIVQEARLDTELGLVGDGWLERGSRHTIDGAADPACQLTLISTRVLAAIEPDRRRWPLAGDQLYVDFDLAVDSLPAGTRLDVGTARIEISEKPHTGCATFSERFGVEALRWLSTPVGKAHRMRGVNARIVASGTVQVGDTVRRV